MFTHFVEVNPLRIEQLSQEGFTFVAVKVERKYRINVRLSCLRIAKGEDADGIALADESDLREFVIA
jgi:hypothetical protein